MAANDNRPFATESDRLQAFSDGVLAVIITIMVLDLHPPHNTVIAALRDVIPTFCAYVLSFVVIGTYWNNHHHMLRASNGINGRAMWANLHLLFWLSLVPFTTAWLGQNPRQAAPTALYGVVLVFCAIAYLLLQRVLAGVNGPNTPFVRAIGSDLKGTLSLILYIASIAIAFYYTLLSDVLFVGVAIIWLVPDRRFQSAINLNREPIGPEASPHAECPSHDRRHQSASALCGDRL